LLKYIYIFTNILDTFFQLNQLHLILNGQLTWCILGD